VSPPPPPAELNTSSTTVIQRPPREFSSRADERDAPGDHWVTIDGNHVLIHDAQGKQPAENEPATSSVVLGKKVVLTFDTKLSADDRLKASNAITAATDLLNKNADKLSADERKAIGQISSLKMIPHGYLGATGKGSMTLSPHYIGEVSSAWLGSLIGHEGQHYLNAGKYSGENLWKDEQSASKTQLAIGDKIGFTDGERTYVQDWMDDKNRAKMQEHMKRGYLD